MKRMVLVVGVMVFGISLMLWAGWHNLRERKLEMQRAQENKIELIPGKSGSAGQVGASEGRAEFRYQFLGGIGVIPESLP